MAKAIRQATPDTEAPEVVQLKCDALGIKSKDFEPAHAKALLAFQVEKGYTDWQPVDETPAPTE